ncbi:uncharacterized protein LOC121370277 [Gigantopelta aegis]|uniref:uncharacterized protein LOC121370277 n=1 Tax=Gigantopelta aegis TaxID=1735272 RepID=UPI001B88B3EF|nr:uncharacterized protein LOC121370277 [Gigantopelta aegis]
MDGILRATSVFLTGLFILSKEVNAELQNIYASGCNDQKLTLQCPEHHRIAINRIFYGVKTDPACRRGTQSADCCQVTYQDCRVNDDSHYPTLNTRCSGYQRCSFPVESVSTGKHCQEDQWRTDYMTVIYDCVPNGDIAHFCSDDSKQAKVLYLANKEYPSSMKGSIPKCSCLVSTGRSRGLNLHSIDILLAKSEYGGRTCDRFIKVEDSFGYNKQITCGHRGLYGFRTIYTRTTQNVSLILESLPGDGTAYIFLQIKPTDSSDHVRIHCGESLRRLLAKPYDTESRIKTDIDEGEVIRTSTINNRPPNESASAGAWPLTPDMAAIVGGIVAASFVIFAILIIAIALHCRRMRRAKTPKTQVELYPAMSSAPLDVTSYCRYDYDDDNYCSISRSPLKVMQYDTTNKNMVISDAFTNPDRQEVHTMVHYSADKEDTLPNGTRGHGNQGNHGNGGVEEPLLNGTGRDYLAIKDGSHTIAAGVHKPHPSPAQENIVISGHRTLPDSRHHQTCNYVTRSPPAKPRSKSVTFQQPVAMVTPLPSGSEESMMEQESAKMAADNYDEMDLPDLDISLSETIPIPRLDVKEQEGNGYPRPLSTFRSPEEEKIIAKKFDIPSPPCLDSSTGQYDNLPYFTGKEKSFWLPSQDVKPVIKLHPKVQLQRQQQHHQEKQQQQQQQLQQQQVPDVKQLPNGKTRVYETGV